MRVKKYEFTGETRLYCNEYYGRDIQLRRIRALQKIPSFDSSNNPIAEGALGGWIEKEDNLSQHGVCWVADDAIVFGDTRVTDDARVCHNAVVGNKRTDDGHLLSPRLLLVKDNSRISGNADVHGSVWLSEHVSVYSDATIFGENITLSGRITLYDKSTVQGNNIKIEGRCELHGQSNVISESFLSGNVVLYDLVSVSKSRIEGVWSLYGNIVIHNGSHLINHHIINNGDTESELHGYLRLGANAYIMSTRDVIGIGPMDNKDFTFYLDRDNRIWVCVRYDTYRFDTFLASIREQYEEQSIRRKEYENLCSYVKQNFLLQSERGDHDG
jgi:carbonic anhydrase/acetyltransferase-like protein (isoleucine patch superfamily)